MQRQDNSYVSANSYEDEEDGYDEDSDEDECDSEEPSDSSFDLLGFLSSKDYDSTDAEDGDEEEEPLTDDEDGETVVYCYFRILSHPLSISLPVRLKGLEPDGIYKLEENDVCYGGDELKMPGSLHSGEWII